MIGPKHARYCHRSFVSTLFLARLISTCYRVEYINRKGQRRVYLWAPTDWSQVVTTATSLEPE